MLDQLRLRSCFLYGLVSFLLIFVYLPVLRAGDGIGEVDKYAEARRLYEQGVLGESARLLRSHLDTEPTDFNARKLLARIYLDLEDFYRLHEQAILLVEQRPEDGDGQRWLELARREIERLRPQRLAELREAVRHDPENVALRVQLAEMYVRMEEEARAVEAFESAYELRPDDPGLTLAYARFLVSLERFDRAEELYLAYLSLPEEPDPRVRQEMFDVLLAPGMRHLEEGELDDAIEHYQRVVERYPEELHLRLQYARMLSWAEMYEESVEVYESYLEEKDDPQVRLDKIRAMAWQGAFPAAARRLRVMLEEEPENLGAMNLLADIYRWNDDMDMAERLYRQVLELDPDNQDALSGLQELTRMDEVRREEARRYSIPYMEELHRQNPDDPDVRLQLARLYTAAGRHPLARSHYAFYLGRRPDEIHIRREYAAVLSNIDDYDEAIRQLRIVLDDHPDDVASRMQVANMLMWLSRHHEAERELRTLLEYIPENPEVHWNLGRIAQIFADWEPALEHYRRVLELAPEYRVAAARIVAIEANPFRRLAAKEAAVERAPDDIQARMALANLLFEMERYYEARIQAEAVLARRPRHFESERLKQRADNILERHRANQIRELRTQLRANPRDLDRHLELARLLKQDGAYREAKVRFRLYLRAYPDDFDARLEYAEMLSWAPEYQHLAADEYRELAAMRPDDYELQLQKIRILTWRPEHWREAEAELEELLILDPENWEMYTAMAELHRYQGRYAQAREMYETIEQIDPGNPQAREGLEEIDKQLRSRFDFTMGMMSDSDSYTEAMIGGRYHSFSQDGTRYTAGLTLYNFSQGGDGSASALMLTGEIASRLAENLVGSARLDLGAYSMGGSIVSGGLRGSYAMDPINTLSLEYRGYPAIHEVKTVRSLAQDISVDKVTFAWDSNAPLQVAHRGTLERLFFEGYISFASFSDGNQRTAFLVRPYYRFRDRVDRQPALDVMVGWRGLAYTQQSDFYWSPVSHAGPMLGARAQGGLGWDIDYVAEFEVFIPGGEEGGGGTRNLSLNLNRPVSDSWIGALNFNFGQSGRDEEGTYTYAGVIFELLHEF